MKVLLQSLILSLVLTGSAFTQTATDAAKTYFEVLQSGEYDKLAALMKPAALKSFREMLTFDEAIPEEKLSHFYGTFFGEGADRKSVNAMSDVDYFAAFLSFVMKQASAAGGVKFDQVEVLGEVPEGKLMHVVTRTKLSVGEIEMVGMEVISFEKVDGKWMTLLNGEMKGMAAQLQKAFSQ